MAEEREVSTGPYEVRWNGEDDDGNLVPPGVYAIRLSLATATGDTDLASRKSLRTVAVAY